MHKSCKLVGKGGVVITHTRAGVINLQFEGNWMPLTGAPRPPFPSATPPCSSLSDCFSLRRLAAVSQPRVLGVWPVAGGVFRTGRWALNVAAACAVILCRADVSTDVVGKYCYYLDMPLEDRRVPVIVDVALMGRTKIIKLHSAIYIEVRARVWVRVRVGATYIEVRGALRDVPPSVEPQAAPSVRPGRHFCRAFTPAAHTCW